jgi:perosamine synthetase
MKQELIPLAKPIFGAVEKKLVNQALDTGWISSIGSFVNQFAQEFSRAVKVKYALPVSNGTAALHLALIALGIGPGDEVIVPALTFVASANAVRYTGAQPVFIDIEPETFNLDIDQLEKKITKKTKAIMSVDLYGHPVDFNRVKAIARRHRLKFISDSAESLGSLYKGKPVGSQADVSTFSFFGNKTITTGEGGMLVTNNQKIYQTAELYRDQGKQPRIHPYYHTVIGYNYGMTNLQAAVGIGQLRRLKTFVKQKRAIAARYRRLLTDVPGLDFQKEASYARSNWWMFSILVNKKQFGRSRDQLMGYLKQKNIETRPFFYPLPFLPTYKKTKPKNKFPVTKRIAAAGLNLPTFSDLTNKQIEYVVRCIKTAGKEFKT